jgi:hypothetical protein
MGKLMPEKGKITRDETFAKRHFSKSALICPAKHWLRLATAKPTRGDTNQGALITQPNFVFKINLKR